MNYDFEKGEVLLLHKPIEWTSFDLVRKVRNQLTRALGIKKLKVGHAGTLDPLAEGLMIVCTGRQTKNIDSYQVQSKEYIATLYFGATRPSYDRETEIDARFDITDIDEAKVQETLFTFVGKQMQTPPIFSAKKIDGKRAYLSAREGKEVKMRENAIEIYELELLSCELPEIQIRIVCSKGTYIRSLAHDIGKAMNNGAYMAALQRTKIGDFKLTEAISVQEFEVIANQITENKKEQSDIE